jgi:hypothetical protein
VTTSADDGDLSAGLDGGLWFSAGWAARVCDRVYEVVAGVAHHEAGCVEATVVDEDGSEPAVADEHECVDGFVEAGVAASGRGGIDRFGGAPGGVKRAVGGEPFVPAVAGVLFDWREIRLVEVGVAGHYLKEPCVVVRRRLSASGCLEVYLRWPVLPLGALIRIGEETLRGEASRGMELSGEVSKGL